MLFEKHGLLFPGRFGPLLERGRFIHAFSTRRGGVSLPPYHELNLGLNTEDRPERVGENRLRFFQAVCIEPNKLVIPNQAHGDFVRLAESPGMIFNTDAVVTNKPGLVLSIEVADCVSVFLIDAEKGAVGLAHAGWRGTAKSIALKTVQLMQKAFGSSPEGMLAFIGPSIGPCCYAVGEDTASAFASRYVQGGKLDLRRANEDQLVNAGLKKANVVQSRLCTVCHPEWFFSHRASGGKTGRMLAVLGLVNPDSITPAG
jgi:YfiH family protein